MGIESILKVGAPIIGGLLGSKSSSPKSTTSTQQQQLDPRISEMLFGGNGQQGILSQYRSMLDTPRSTGAQMYANANEDFLGRNGGTDLAGVRNAAYQSMAGNSAPTAQAAQSAVAGQSLGDAISNPAWAQGNMVKPPSQNNIDLTGSYQNLLSGGNTKALMSSLQAGNALTNQQLQQNQASLTENFQKNVLPSIRSGAIANGQYGGSRQGIAEGNAISDLTKQLSNANTQVGLANSANNANALAGAYENGQNRALSATQGLGAQQYGVASQDANTRNQAEFMNVNNALDVLKTNAGLRQNNAQFNAGQQQQNSQFNAGLQQQTNLANLQAQLGTNAQNNSSLLGGAGLLSGLLGQVSGSVNANDNWSLNRAQGVNSLLAPYLGVNQTTSRTDPLYSSTAGNAIAGLGLGSQLGGLLGGNGSSAGSLDGLMKFFNAGPGVIG